MARWNVGEKNGLWKGGRSIASSGYVLVRVGKDHHLADTRGYAYEHRVEAEKKLGRRLVDGELVHHINHDKLDNRHENLEVCSGNAEHLGKHRSREDRRRHDEPNVDVKCACGCGTTMAKYDASGRPRKFVSGHNAGERNRVYAAAKRRQLPKAVA